MKSHLQVIIAGVVTVGIMVVVLKWVTIKSCIKMQITIVIIIIIYVLLAYLQVWLIETIRIMLIMSLML